MRYNARVDYNTLTFTFFLIFTGAAILASAALYTRQPIILAHILLGAIIGPYGLGWINDVALLEQSGHVGIVFLLFLLGLDMQPQALKSVLRQASIVALASSLAFFCVGWLVAEAFGFSRTETIIIGLSMMFSSTIISIKLLPTTVLHHRRTGDLIIGLLILQDLIAIFVLIILLSGASPTSGLEGLGHVLLALPALVLGALFLVRYVLLKLIARFDGFHEYIFLLAIGWCLGVAEFAAILGLSGEIGAFVAGITLATSPISQYIAINLKPLRDFFLVLFFFALGARFNLAMIQEILLAAVTLTILVIALKPLVFRVLLGGLRENKALCWSVGFRLGQNSEFSLLIAYVSANVALIGTQASHLIQAVAILSFVISTYIVIFNFPSPISVSEKLRRD